MGSASGAPPTTIDSSDTLSEVVVTARRRSENLENVPVSVTALNAAQLMAQGVASQSDLQSAVPGLVVRQTENQNDFNYAIRGQTVDAFSGSRPAVASYLNEVAISQTSQSSLYDLGSVQVLKGPQGTLFGRNVTGGAVLFSTERPGNDFDGYITVKQGNLNWKEFQGAVDLPVVPDTVLLRVAADIDDRDGFQHNIYNNTDLGSQARRSIRTTLVVRPTETIQNTLVFEYDHSAGSNIDPVPYSAYACGSSHNGAPLATAATCFFSPALDNTFGPGAWAAYLAAHPSVPSSGIVGYINQQHAMGPWEVDADFPSSHLAHSYYVSNTTTVDMTPDIQLKNIVGFSDSATRDINDLDGSPYGILLEEDTEGSMNGYDVNALQGSEELQLLGKTFDHQLDYILGLYYEAERDINYANLSDFDLSPVFGPIRSNNHNRTVDHTEAAYFQGTYSLAALTGVQGLSATAGYRYSWDQSYFNELGGEAPSVYFGDPPEKFTSSRPSWQLGLEYQLTGDLLLYLEQRGSWRAGGFNTGPPPIASTADAGGNEFRPETTRDVELGMKYQGDAVGRPIRLNVALYNQWIYNVQRVLYVTLPKTGLASVTANAPAAIVRGIESDGQVSPIRWLDVGMNVAFTDARYTRPNVELFSQSFTFGPYGDTARVSGTVFAQAHLPAPASLGAMTLRGEVYAQTYQYFSNLDNTSNPGSRLPGYGILNFRYAWQNVAGSRVGLAAFVKNATDRPYFVGGLPLGSAFGLNGAMPGEPRTYGLELNYRF
jgi:iron complex outermembrane receptor protein